MKLVGIMRFLKQGVKLEVSDEAEREKNDAGINNQSYSPHGLLFGKNPIRALICGPSGSGKSCTILSLLLHPNGLRFENVYLFSRTLNQEKYQFLRRVLEPLSPEIGFYAYGASMVDGQVELLRPEAIKPHSIVIFDDIITTDYKILREYFAMSRHFALDIFFCTHSYVLVPKNLIRINLTMIVLFKMDVLNVRHVYDDHIQGDMDFETFKTMCSKCWLKNNFLLVDKDKGINDGRYRMGFDVYILPQIGGTAS